MHPALEVAGRRLGFALGDPNLAGSIYAISSDQARASDASPWTRAIWWLAVAPTAAVIFALFAATRIAASMVRGARTRSPSVTPLTYGLGGFILGDALARRRNALVQFWRLDTPVGARLVRIAIPPSHPSDVRIGDAVQCWVRAHRDGTFSVDRADNLATGERITPQRPSLALVAGAAAWLGILLISVFHLL